MRNEGHDPRLIHTRPQPPTPRKKLDSHLSLQQLYSAAPGAEQGAVLAWFPKTPLPRGVRLVRVSAAGPQTEEHGDRQILKQTRHWESRSINSLPLIKQTENNFGQVPVSWTWPWESSFEKGRGTRRLYTEAASDPLSNFWQSPFQHPGEVFHTLGVLWKTL